MFSLLRTVRAAAGTARVVLVALLVAIPTAEAFAQTFPTDCLPPQTTYAGQFHAKYSDGTNVFDLTDPRHADFVGCDPPPPPGGTTTHTLQSSVGAMVSVNGGPPQPFNGAGPMTVKVESTNQKSGPTRFFDTEMLQLDIVAGPVLVRESPTRPSLGKTAITDLGGGLYHIDSFFDVFTELSVDGGQTWMPSTDANGNPYAGRMQIPGTVAITRTPWGDVKLLYSKP